MAKRSANVLNTMLSAVGKKTKSMDEARKSDLAVHAMLGDNQGSGSRGPKLPTHTSQAPDGAIANFLLEMREAIDSQGYGATVEVELRLGKITSSATGQRFSGSTPGDACVILQEADMKSHGAKFVPGVKKEDYLGFHRKAMKLTMSDAYAKHVEHQNVSTFPGSKRVVEEIDLNTGQTMAPYQQVKQRLGTIDIFLPHCDYDCRVAISLEFAPTPVSLESLPAPEHRRGKKRESAVGRDVRVDLTEVHEGDVVMSYEVELELQPTMVKDWLNLPEDQTWKGAIGSAGVLWSTVSRHFMVAASQAYRQTWDAVDPDNALRHAYQRHFDNPQKFPGTMPVGFARWHIPNVRDRDYFCSEKTDGVRYFLVAANQRVVLVDRSNLPFTAPGLEALSWLLPDGTVLDGEYVLHQKQQRFIYMAFDVIAIGPLHADSCVKKIFRDRLNVLFQFLADEGPYLQGIRSHAIHMDAVLPLLRKRWTPVKEIRHLFDSIKSMKLANHAKTRVRVYADDKREHFTDGVVFCPGQSPYVSFSHPGTGLCIIPTGT
ncbi:hypothetical protein H310_14289 [Aphanomyces invadans]|uniref:mRNA 5'-phosphatase n=1 Tax=Aphanomyces invadans TaxID=157072 RepID=A0A024TAM2_9STRA|nr:hypothetical protein H310_14289 [Aphanomyces invadans]ETV91049.1 hypothetical protein H310_14289 [Aphanomyces invadans]|eukprot:XP_008880329.1 hypothetical protein H310_14289 [Aphanomyces invadans]